MSSVSGRYVRSLVIPISAGSIMLGGNPPNDSNRDAFWRKPECSVKEF